MFVPHRQTRVAVVESMTYVAGTVSVFVSGVILQATSHQAVFAICCCCVGVAALYGLLWLDSIKPTEHTGRKGMYIKDVRLDQIWAKLDKSGTFIDPFSDLRNLS